MSPQDGQIGPMVQRNLWILADQSQRTSPGRHGKVCGFNVEKINQDKVAALFKTREVDNPLCK
uniref:Uncharacterized protein n=1 Tax=Romanomermis culicivorax TaxID=13658 RepID=A0A915I7C4_ROMCU